MKFEFISLNKLWRMIRWKVKQSYGLIVDYITPKTNRKVESKTRTHFTWTLYLDFEVVKVGAFEVKARIGNNLNQWLW